MRRTTLAGLGTLALVTLLAACNGGGSNADSMAVSDSTATDPTPSAMTTDSARADSIRRADSANAATKTP